MTEFCTDVIRMMRRLVVWVLWALLAAVAVAVPVALSCGQPAAERFAVRAGFLIGLVAYPTVVVLVGAAGWRAWQTARAKRADEERYWWALHDDTISGDVLAVDADIASRRRRVDRGGHSRAGGHDGIQGTAAGERETQAGETSGHPGGDDA